MKLVFVTHNENKMLEIKSMFPEKIRLLSLKAINCSATIKETGQTLEENALLKAKYVYEKYMYDCFADDTGLEVEALNGMPGVISARYAGEPKDDSKNIQKLLAEMKNEKNRTAYFRTVIALFLKKEKYIFEGKIKGDILYEPVGKNGFGYDSVFQPFGYTKSFGQFTLEEKNKISHRFLSLKKLLTFLKKN